MMNRADGGGVIYCFERKSDMEYVLLGSSGRYGAEVLDTSANLSRKKSVCS